MNTYDLFLHYTEAESRTHSTILLFEGEKEAICPVQIGKDISTP